jgi:hypothetical protein
MAGNMAFSLIFNVLDQATAPIKAIASALSEPADAAATVGEAGEKAGTRLGAGLNRAHEAVLHLGDAFRHPISRIAEFGKAAGEASEKFARSFGGMGAMVAEGLSIRDVAGQKEFFDHLKINTDMSKAGVDQLKDSLNSATMEFGVNQGAMMDAFKSFRANGGTVESFKADARTIAASIQLMGASAEDAGKLTAAMGTTLHIKKPEEILGGVALLRKQLVGIDGGFASFAGGSDRLGESMEALGMKGNQALAAVGAVFAVAAKGAGGNGRKAMIATQGWLDDLTQRGYQAQLSQGLGESVVDKNGRVDDPRILMQKMAAKYAEAMKLPENRQVAAVADLDRMFGESAAKMFKAVGGEIKATGGSATMDRILGTKGDGAELLDKASRAGEGLSASMNRLRTSMSMAAESVFTGPLEIFATAMNACGGTVGKMVLGLAAMAAAGHAIGWIYKAIEGFKLLRATLLVFEFKGIVTGLVSVGGAIWSNVAAVTAWTASLARNAVAWTAIRLSGLVSGLASVASGLVPVIAASWAWTAAMLANPVSWIVMGVVAAVAAVGAAAYYLYQNWTKIWGGIGGAVSTVWSAIESVFQPAVSFFTGVWDGVKGVFNALANWLGAGFCGDLVTIFKACAAPVLMFAALPLLIVDHWSEIVAFFKGVWDGITTGLSDHLVKPATEAFQDLIKPVTDLGAGIKDILGGAWDWVGHKCSEMVDWVSQKLDGLFDKLNQAKDWLADVTRPAREMVKGAVGAVAHSAPVQYMARAADKAIDTLEMGQRTKQAVAFFESKGWTHNQAAGVAASFKGESSFNSFAVGDGGHAYGLGQWHEDRQAEFAKRFGHDIHGSSMEEQLEFAHYELTQGKEKAAGDALARTATAADAGAVVSARYERPADQYGEASRRAASAEAIAGAVPGSQVAANDNKGTVGAAVPSAPALAAAPQPLSRPESAPGASGKTENVIVIRFDNLPKGARPQVQSQSPGLAIQLDRGSSMAAG